MDKALRTVYEFGPFRLTPAEQQLLRNGEPMKLSPKLLEVLVFMVQRSGRLIEKDEFMEGLWKGTFVEEGNLSNYVYSLRKKLGTEEGDEKYIETVPKRGYRFAAKVKEVVDQPVSFTKSVTASEDTRTEGASPKYSPYVGPGPYTEDRSADFFGRDREIEEVVKLLSDPEKRLVLLYSPSGAGKTSLINAALRPALREKNFRVLPTARLGVPAGLPLAGQNPYTFAAITSIEQGDDSVEFHEPTDWTTYIGTKNPTSPTILIIDQLEEMITTDLGSPAMRREFFVELLEALAQHKCLAVLLAFREEYLAELQRLAGELSPYWNSYPLALLSREAAETAITRPAARQGVKFDTTVLSQVVSQLAIHHRIYDGQLYEDPGEFVEPLQLQLVCDTLWKRLKLHQRTITLEDLREATTEQDTEAERGRARGTVSRFVHSVLHSFCEQAVRRASARGQRESGWRFPIELIDLGCQQFVSERGTRTWVRQEGKWTGDLPNDVANELARQQLLRIEQRRHGERWFELAHDTLIQPVLDRVDRIDDDALYELFLDAVRELVADQGSLDETAIGKEFCLAFIAEDGSALLASDESLKNSADRLPLWVTEALSERGMLRRVSNEEQKGYELVHRRMATVIHGKRFRAVDRYFRTRKLLDSYIEDYRRTGSSPQDWYLISDNTTGRLHEIETDIGFANLTELETGFVLRASLATGYHCAEVAIATAQLHPAVVAEIVKEAAQHTPSVRVRENAALVLEFFLVDHRETLLINLALNDPDESVRLAAANALATFENSKAWETLFELLDDPVNRSRALSVLAWMHDATPDPNMQQFEKEASRLSLWSRACFRAKLISTRWQYARTRIVVAGAVALVSTIVFTVPTRAILAIFNLTTSQKASMGLLEGILNGVFGVIPWGVFIGGGLLVWWFIVEGRRPWRGRISPIIGVLAGLLGGVINTLELVLAYGRDTLVTMHWIPSNAGGLTVALIQSGYGFIFPLYGAFVGLGVGLAARRMLHWWYKRLAGARREAGYPMFLAIVFETTLNSWLILLPMIAVAVAFRGFLSKMPHASVSFPKLLGEALSVSFGGVGLVVGLFLGLHVLRKGLHLPGREE